MRVLEHNNEYAANKKPFKLSLNQFSYLTHEEYMKKHVNLDSPFESPLTVMNQSLNISTIVKPEQPSIQFDHKASVPDSYDWRSFNMVSPPKHQLQCGSCWAFATVLFF